MRCEEEKKHDKKHEKIWKTEQILYHAEGAKECLSIVETEAVANSEKKNGVEWGVGGKKKKSKPKKKKKK